MKRRWPGTLANGRAEERGAVVVRTIDTGWQRRAACRGPESTLFYPPTLTETRQDREAREARARAICATCEVRAECLECALRIREPHGIWGGLNENERRELLDPGALGTGLESTGA